MIAAQLLAAAALLFVVGGVLLACLWPAFVIDRPRLVLGVLAGVTIAAGAALVRLDPPGLAIDVDPSSEPLLRRNDPERAAYDRATRDFGNDDLFVIALETEDVFARESLASLRRLTGRLLALPGVAAVESLARVLHVRYDEARGVVGVSPFVGEIPEDPAALADLRERALADPLYRKTLVSADGRAAALNLTFQPMTDGEFVALDLDGRIEALLDAERDGARGGRRFHVTGRPHIRSQAYHLMVGDLARLIPVAVAVAALVMWGMSGSLRQVAIPLGACLAATLWTHGAMAALGIDVNLISLVLAPLLIAVGSVYGVHVYARHELIAAETRDRRSAAIASLRYSRTPVLLAGITTCIGFAAPLLADIQATNELGAFAILGVASVTLISLTGVPAALRLLPPRLASRGTGRGAARASARFGAALEGLLAAIAGLVERRSGAVLAAWALVTAAAALAIPRIVIDTDVIAFFQRDSRIRQDFAAVNRLLAGAVPLYVVVDGGAEGAFREPQNLRALERLQARLEEVPGVSDVLGLVDFVRMANRAMQRGRPEAARIPDTRSEVAETTFLLPKATIRRFATSNHERVNLVVRTGEAGSAAVRALEARIRDVLASADLPPGFTTAVTGNTLLLNRTSDAIAGNQVAQVGLAAAAIFALMGGVFRSLRIAALAMVPNIVPVLLFFGILGAGAAPLSLPTSLVGCIALGIAIDDTSHFLVAYRWQRQRGLTPPEAARRCLRTVGRPIVMTSVMLVAGFLVILASSFATLREFGALSALTMALCLACDLVLLPALLVKLRA